MVKRQFPPRAPYLIAALESNHDGRVETARRLVTTAAEIGADAVVITMPIDGPQAPTLSAAGWRSVRRAARRRIDVIVAPHSLTAFARARQLAPEAYQIDPPVVGDIDLLKRIARERRPVCLVGGACTERALARAVRALRGCPIVVLHSVAVAGLPPERARLRYIETLGRTLGTTMGYYGRETGPGWAAVAVALGARVIEKAFTLDSTRPGAQHASSLGPDELRGLVRSLRDLTAALLAVPRRRVFSDELVELERAGLGLVATRRLSHGHKLRRSDLRAAPGQPGLSAGLASRLVGHALRYDLEPADPITFGVVDLRVTGRD